jgi:membrane-associated HD superfamily phosphohydrolase
MRWRKSRSFSILVCYRYRTGREVYLDFSHLLFCYILSLFIFFVQIAPNCHSAVYCLVSLFHVYLLLTTASSLLTAVTHNFLSFLAVSNNIQSSLETVSCNQLESAPADLQGDSVPPRGEVNASHSNKDRAALALQVRGA